VQTRWWVWVALGGFAVGVALLAFALRQVAKTLPDDVLRSARDAIRKRARLASVAGVVAAWTLVYALYSMSAPSGVRVADDGTPSAVALAPIDQTPTTPAPGVRRVIVPSGPGPVVVVEEDDDPPPPLPPIGPAPGDAGPEQAPCSTQDQAEAIRQAQDAAEALTGQPIYADVATLVEVAAGCGDAASALLALLGPVGGVMDQLGLLPDTIPLPDAPALDLPKVPEPIAAPLRPAVFQACAEASRQLVTVGALAPFFHLDYDQFVRYLSTLDRICGTFAPGS
jgi:hypothetical protein